MAPAAAAPAAEGVPAPASSEPFAYAAAETVGAHQFSLNPPTPHQLAKAVFNRPITGRPIGLHGVTEKESHQDCMMTIKQVLREYFYELELFTNKNNLDKIRAMDGYKDFASGHVPFSTGRSCYGYCGCCSCDSIDPKLWGRKIIAVFLYKKHQIRLNGVDVFVSQVTVTSLFPHSSECATTHEYRRNQTFSKSNGGRGWIKESFPIDEIFRDAFSAVTERLSGLQKNGEHFGMFFKYSLTVILFDRSSKKT